MKVTISNHLVQAVLRCNIGDSYLKKVLEIKNTRVIAELSNRTKKLHSFM